MAQQLQWHLHQSLLPARMPTTFSVDIAADESLSLATTIAVRCITFTVGNRRSRFQLIGLRQYRATIVDSHCCFPILLARYALWSVIGVKPGSTGLELFNMPRQLSTLSHVTSSLARDSLRLAFLILLQM